MTREQAKREIVSLDFYLLNHTDDYGEESHTAMMMAINALEELPKRRKEAKRWKTKAMQNNSCDDAISRQAAIDVVSGIDRHFVKYIKELPTVTPIQRTGHWIEKDGFDGDVYYDCSECGESWTTIEGTPWQNGMCYCPNCGAKMVEPQESEEGKS